MLCTCGQTASITLPRRDMPYCRDCFEHMLVRAVRSEVGQNKISLQPLEPSTNPDDSNDSKDSNNISSNYADWLEGAEKLAKIAHRDIEWNKQGMKAGCAEISAQEAVKFLFSQAKTRQTIFPSSITQEEMQIFLGKNLELTEPVAKEIQQIEQRYPGTINSIIHSAVDREHQSKYKKESITNINVR